MQVLEHILEHARQAVADFHAASDAEFNFRKSFIRDNIRKILPFRIWYFFNKKKSVVSQAAYTRMCWLKDAYMYKLFQWKHEGCLTDAEFHHFYQARWELY